MNSTTQLQLQRNQDRAAIIELEPTLTVDLNNKKADLSETYFDRLLLEAVDSTFSMLGDSTKQILYFHLKNSFGVNKEAIPHNLEVFINSLEQLFGQGALILEARIMETLQLKVPRFRFYPKQKELTLLCYLESLRIFLQNTAKPLHR